MSGVLTGTAPAAACAAPATTSLHQQGEPAQGLRLVSCALPAGAVARLTKRCGATGMTGGKRAEEWILTFPPRWRGRTDPLTGWWGASDPLASLTLRFPSRRAAEDYARREGLSLEVCEPRTADACHRAAAFAPADDVAVRADPSLPWIWDGRSAYTDMTAKNCDDHDAGKADIDIALLDPAAVFKEPMKVVADPRLTPEQKREILARWEHDARLIEAAQTEGMPETGESSRLEEVLAAQYALREVSVARVAPSPRQLPTHIPAVPDLALAA
ncbi:NADH dehydrogenase ubiquinone Fe-S protein 4 [Roseomonas chloroacetimidivorans]|uniref:NADH dehydrogenase ubiquinone Fe-S protein 4 n=1 Tax=Roseomonas chloroacetimidivorans TaxID=1766656 RepID=UPI003C767929